MHRCILSTVATDALVPKDQAIATQSPDYVLIQFQKKYSEQHWRIKLHFKNKYPGVCLIVNEML